MLQAMVEPAGIGHGRSAADGAEGQRRPRRHHEGGGGEEGRPSNRTTADPTGSHTVTQGMKQEGSVTLVFCGALPFIF